MCVLAVAIHVAFDLSAPYNSNRNLNRYYRTRLEPCCLSQDAEGVRLFRKFVGGAGALHVDRLNFHFAVQGLRQESDHHKIRQVVSAIYKSVPLPPTHPPHWRLSVVVQNVFQKPASFSADFRKCVKSCSKSQVV